MGLNDAKLINRQWWQY